MLRVLFSFVAQQSELYYTWDENCTSYCSLSIFEKNMLEESNIKLGINSML